MVSSAEILRDAPESLPSAELVREPPGTPPAGTPPSTSFQIPGLPDFDTTAREAYGQGGTREQQIEQAKIRASSMRPEYRSIQEGIAERDRKAADIPPVPVLGEPPSRGLRDFLAVSENESPVASIGKLMQALSLFTMGTFGSSRRSAVGAMAAFSGAMQGWAVGDAERADRAFSDYQAKTAKVLKEHELARTRYADVMSAADKNLDGRMRSAQLVALENGDQEAILKLQSGSLDEFLGLLINRQDQEDKLRQADRDLVFKVTEAAQKRHQFGITSTETARSNRTNEGLRAQEIAGTADERALRRQEREDKLEAGKILPAGEVEKLGDIRAGIKQLRDLKGAFDPSYTGPVASYLKWAQSRTVGLPEKEEQFRSTLANFENILLKGRSGAAVTPTEYDRIRRELPQLNEDPKKFLAKLGAAETMLSNILSEKTATFKGYGYRVPDEAGAITAPAPAAAPAASAPVQVWVRDKDGKLVRQK